MSPDEKNSLFLGRAGACDGTGMRSALQPRARHGNDQWSGGVM